MPAQYTFKPGKGLVNVNAQPVQNQYNNVGTLRALTVSATNLTATGNVDFSLATVNGGPWLQPVIDTNAANAATISGQQTFLNNVSGGLNATQASITTLSGSVATSATTITNYNTSILTDTNVLTKQGVVERDAYYLIWGNENVASELNTATTALAGPIKWMLRMMKDPLTRPVFSATVSGASYRDGVWSVSGATSSSISGSVPTLITSAKNTISGASMAVVFLRLFEQDLVSATPPRVATLMATAQTIINAIVNAGWIPAIVTPVPNASYSFAGKSIYWQVCNAIMALKITNRTLIVLDASTDLVDRNASSFTALSMPSTIYTTGATATPTFVGSLTAGKIFRDRMTAQNIVFPFLKNLLLGGEEPASISINPYVAGSNPITSSGGAGAFPPQNLFGITPSGTVMNSASGSAIPPGYILTGNNVTWSSMSLVQAAYNNRVGLQLQASGTVAAGASGSLILASEPKLTASISAANMAVTTITIDPSIATITNGYLSLSVVMNASGFLASNFPGRPTTVPVTYNLTGSTGGSFSGASLATLVYGSGPNSDQLITLLSVNTPLVGTITGTITCFRNTITATAGTFNGFQSPCAMSINGADSRLAAGQYMGTVTAGTTAHLYHSVTGSAGAIPSGATLSLCAPTSYTPSVSSIMGIADVDFRTTSSNLREVVCGLNLTTPVVSGSVTTGSAGYQTLLDGERMILKTPVATTVAGDVLTTRGETTLTFASETMGGSPGTFTVNAFINYLGSVIV